VTPFSSPNTPYALTLTVPTVPSDFLFVDVDNGVFGLETTATVNGVAFPGSNLLVFAESSEFGAGVLVCLGACQPDPNTVPYPAANFWNIVSDSVFSGGVANPTFVSGALNVNAEFSSVNITAPVPEPTSLSLFVTGVFGLGVFSCRKRSRRFEHPDVA
jgi:hypothetical protein